MITGAIKLPKLRKNLAKQNTSKASDEKYYKYELFTKKHHILYIKYWYLKTNIPYILYILYLFIYSIPTKIYQSSSYWSV